MSTGERIRKLRKAKHMNQSELAELVGNDGNTISRWELGKMGIGSGYITKLAQVLGTSTDYLLGKTDDPTPPDISEVNSAPDDILGHQPMGKRLIIKNNDMYINLPETPEGFEILRRLFDMQAMKSLGPVNAALVQA